jgi:preprotein translocase subunit SecB
LKVDFQPAAEANVPYSFSLNLTGLFKTSTSISEERVEKLVKTNGATILYGIAREMVRNLVGSGPCDGPILPSVSFFESEAKPAETRKQDKEPKPERGGSIP